MKQFQQNALNILNNVSEDTTADLLEKAMGHKYYKREGTPGNYKYYYTEAEYRAAKGKPKDSKSKEIIEKDGKKYKLQSNGKYLEVSELGMTKKEHERDRDYFSKRAASEGRINNKTSEENVRKHHTAASKLSDKEFTKEELEDKKENPSLVMGDLNFNHDYMIVREGGSIGEKRDTYFPQYNGSAYKTSNNREDLRELAKTKNKSLSPGEKSYYGIKYSVKPITNSIRNSFLKKIK